MKEKIYVNLGLGNRGKPAMTSKEETGIGRPEEVLSWLVPKRGSGGSLAGHQLLPLYLHYRMNLVGKEHGNQSVKFLSLTFTEWQVQRLFLTQKMLTALTQPGYEFNTVCKARKL